MAEQPSAHKDLALSPIEHDRQRVAAAWTALLMYDRCSNDQTEDLRR